MTAVRRSAAVALGVGIQRLVTGLFDDGDLDQALVLDALRRSSASLRDASEAELADYLRAFTSDQMRGVLANVKGIFHELLAARAENLDGDATSAALFAAANHPGADLEYIVDGAVIGAVQLKAVQSPAAIAEHFARYPDIDVLATSEVAAALGEAYAGRVSDSGFANGALDETVGAAFASLEAGPFDDLLAGSPLVAGALQASAFLGRRRVDSAELRRTLEAAGVGLGAALTMDILISAI